MLAITRSLPPQRRQTSMSIQASEATPKQANTRLRRCTQVRVRYSEALTTIEYLRPDPQTQQLELTILHSDRVFFNRKFEPASASYAPSELEVEPFGCQPMNPDRTLIE